MYVIILEPHKTSLQQSIAIISFTLVEVIFSYYLLFKLLKKPDTVSNEEIGRVSDEEIREHEIKF